MASVPRPPVTAYSAAKPLQISTTDTPPPDVLVPGELPPSSQGSGLTDPLTHAQSIQLAANIGMTVVSAEDFLQNQIDLLQDAVNALSAVNQQQDTEIARLTAAMQAMPCPLSQSPNIAACTQQGICTCPSGFALNSPAWHPIP